MTTDERPEDRQGVPTRLPWLTFDCYGTLVTWDGGLREAFGNMLGTATGDSRVAKLLERFKPVQFEMMQAARYQPLKSILPAALREAMLACDIPYADPFGEQLIAAVAAFGPFPDVPPALEELRRSHRLAIISNSDDDIIAGNVRAIGVSFDRVITAEQARAYKPQPAIFEYAMRELGVSPEAVVHIAAGFVFDIAPAAKLGYRRIWINRGGAEGDAACGPYGELPSLTGLSALLEKF